MARLFAGAETAGEDDVEIMEGKTPETHVPADTDITCHAPPMEKRYFASWDEFNEYLSEYEDATHQVFRKRTSTSTAARNKDLTDRGKISPSTKIPSCFDKYYMRLICTHGWSRSSRSTGKRSKYFAKSTQCEAQLSLTVVWTGDLEFQVKVSQQVTGHNHNLTQRTYDNHPVNRRIDDPELIDFVDQLQAAGAKKKLIMEFLRRRTGKQVTLRDVHNLVASLKQARRGETTVESRLESCLQSFCSRKRNAVTVYVDDEKLAQTITFQTAQMRRFFEAFPEVMMVDATHDTNDAKYNLFSFMIHDVFGHGQYVQHALMENESAKCMTDAFTSFKSFNSAWDKIRVIVVDKDFGEISLLREAFPDARILLCVFHVVKNLRSEMSKREYGLFDREKASDAVHMMLSAQTEAEYERARKYLYYIVEGKHVTENQDVPEPEHPFTNNFHANWHKCREMWSGFGRVDVPHVGNTTNNRLEAAWGHLKEVLKPSMMLDECVDTLMFLQSITEIEYAKKITDVGYMHYAGADSELQKLAKEVSQHAYELVERQYRIANDRKTFYTVCDLHKNVKELTSSVDSTRVYHLDTTMYKCSCSFMRTELLPCRHIIYWRLISNISPIPMKHIHQRWCLRSPINAPVDEEEPAADKASCPSFRVKDSSLLASRHKVLNGTNKYRTAHHVGCQIADTMSRNGTAVFLKMLKVLRIFEDTVRDGEAPMVIRCTSLRDTLYEAEVQMQTPQVDEDEFECESSLPSTTVNAGVDEIGSERGDVCDLGVAYSPECYPDGVEVEKCHPNGVREFKSHSDEVNIPTAGEIGVVQESSHFPHQSVEVNNEKTLAGPMATSKSSKPLSAKRAIADEAVTSESSEDSSFCCC